ncbi:MAG: hypothetical protein QNJ94_20410 [Alphaproteobacteria bacterium]|nr:hypothetical protein [Alphaproteobacteria bacterium]
MQDRPIRRAFLGALLGLAAVFVSPLARAEEPQCKCRYAGQYYLLGQCVCMKTSSGEQMACCGRVLNNTSWSFKSDSCVSADSGTTQIAEDMSLRPSGQSETQGMTPRPVR